MGAACLSPALCGIAQIEAHVTSKPPYDPRLILLDTPPVRTNSRHERCLLLRRGGGGGGAVVHGSATGHPRRQLAWRGGDRSYSTSVRHVRDKVVGALRGNIRVLVFKSLFVRVVGEKLLSICLFLCFWLLRIFCALLRVWCLL